MSKMTLREIHDVTGRSDKLLVMTDYISLGIGAVVNFSTGVALLRNKKVITLCLCFLLFLLAFI